MACSRSDWVEQARLSYSDPGATCVLTPRGSPLNWGLQLQARGEGKCLALHPSPGWDTVYQSSWWLTVVGGSLICGVYTQILGIHAPEGAGQQIFKTDKTNCRQKEEKKKNFFFLFLVSLMALLLSNKRFLMNFHLALSP